MKQLVRRVVFAIMLLLGIGMWVVPYYAAAEPAQDPGVYNVNCEKDFPGRGYVLLNDKRTCCPPDAKENRMQCFFLKYVNPVVATLSAIAGLAAVGGIIWGGIMYSSSIGDPQKVSRGKAIITRSLIGIVAFLFLYSAMQFMSPGGLMKQGGGGGGSAAACGKNFLTLKPWFAYLPNDKFDADCSIADFNLLGDDTKKSDFLPVALAIVDNLLRVAAMVAVVFVIVGGINFMTSQGESDKTKRARETVINALIGLAIAMVAAAVISFIGKNIGK